MTIRWPLLGLIALPVALSGCAAGATAAQPAMDDAMSMHHASADGPPKLAAMVCQGDVQREVGQILQLDEPPHTASTWADHVYTCTYHLPMGPLVLSVNVADSADAANSYFGAQRAEAPQASDMVGLGERAFGTAAGDVTVVKDDMTLTVDATALPEVFGSNEQKRSAFAFEVAADVMGCWKEHG